MISAATFWEWTGAIVTWIIWYLVIKTAVKHGIEEARETEKKEPKE